MGGASAIAGDLMLLVDAILAAVREKFCHMVKLSYSIEKLTVWCDDFSHISSKIFYKVWEFF